MAIAFETFRHRTHIIQELGLTVAPDGGELRGFASVVPEMVVPGTDVLRVSVLASWIEIIAGTRAVGALTGLMPVTFTFDFHLQRAPVGLTEVRLKSRLLNTELAAVPIEVEVVGLMVDGGREDLVPLGLGTMTFMSTPAAGMTLPPMAELASFTSEGGERLSMPIARRAHCERHGAGVATIPLMDDSTNALSTLNGGLLALAIEEAALSAWPPGRTVASMNLHFLRPIRTGPAVATATLHRTLARVEVTDVGAGDRLAVMATVRAFDQGA